MTQVSADVGSYFHWGADSKSLHWMVGDQYYSRDLNQSFAFLPGAPKELPKPSERRRHQGRPDACRSTSRATLVAFTHARIVTMRDAETQRGSDRGRHAGRARRRDRGGRRGDVVGAGRRARHRRARQDHRARLRRRARARRALRPGRGAAAELGVLHQPRVRRDHHARPVGDHRVRVLRGRAAEGRADGRPARVLDRHDPVRRRRRLQGGGQFARRRPQPPAPDEGERRVLGQELQPAAPRAAPADQHRRARARHAGGRGRRQRPSTTT